MLQSSEIRRAQPLLGTIVEIWARGINANIAVDAAFAEIQEVQRLMSFHSPDSEVTRINQAVISAAITVSPKTYEVLAFAQMLSDRTMGAFDITMGSSLVSTGFLPRVVSCYSDEYEINYRNLKLLPNDQVLLTKPVCIDLGGIAKGYAVDVAIDCLSRYGLDGALVNAGGDLRFFGQPQTIYLRHPYAAQVLPIGPLTNTAVASSSGYYDRKLKEGNTVNNHAIDPLVDTALQQCLSWGQGVTVMAPTCMIADAMTKVVRLFPPGAIEILETFDAQAIKIDQHGAHLLKDINFNDLQEA